MLEKLNSINASLFILGTVQSSRNHSTVNVGFYLHKGFLESQKKKKYIRDPCWVVKTGDRLCFQTQHIWRCIHLTIKDWLLAALRRRSRAPNMPLSQQCSSVSPQEMCCDTHGLLRKNYKQRKETRKTNTHTHTHFYSCSTLPFPLCLRPWQNKCQYMDAVNIFYRLLETLWGQHSSPEQPLEVTELSMQ